MKRIPKSDGDAGTARPGGRPRNETADDAILQAAIELLAEGGLQALTIQAVSERAGVARGTIYLRWNRRDALVGAAVRRAIGRDPYPLTGDLEADVRRAGEQARAVFSERSFAAIAPALLRELIGPREAPTVVTFDSLFPNRRRFADQYRRVAGEQGFREDVDPEMVVELVSGALFMRFVATARPPTRRHTRHVVELVLDALRGDRRALGTTPAGQASPRR